MPQPPKRYARTRPAPKAARDPSINWEEAVERFLAECRRINLTPATIQNYRAYLNGPRLRIFLADHGLHGPADLTPDRLKELERELFELDLRPSTVATYHRTLKNLAGFCIREGLGGRAEVLEVSGPKLPQSEPEIFTADEERRLLAVAASRPRDQMLVRLMLRTGLRLSEVCELTIDDIVESPDGAYLRVRQGKGPKDRIVPLDTPGDKLSTQLKRYVERVRPRDTARRALFIAHAKQGAEYTPLTRHGIQMVCRRLSEETGIHINPHKFRHTFATRALAAGVDVMALQRALGHTTLAMVSRYVHYQRDDLLKTWQARRD